MHNFRKRDVAMAWASFVAAVLMLPVTLPVYAVKRLRRSDARKERDA